MLRADPVFFRDDYGIGQPAVARIQQEVSGKQALQCAADILTTSYVSPDWLAMRVRLFKDNLAVYRKARDVQAILKSTEIPQ